MNKKIILIGITCSLVLITGVCYSCSYRSEKSSDMLITELSEDTKVSEKEQYKGTKTTDIAAELTAVPTAAATDSANEEAVTQSLKATVYVHLCGAVKKPGVYQVEEDTRVIDVIELAGGLTKEAAGDYINQALKVADGQKIYVPSTTEVEGQSVEAYSAKETSNDTDTKANEQRININTADAKKLMELPGVGEAKAASIIEYRTANGNFQTIEELMKIPGIKEGLFQKVSSLITVK